MILQPFASPYQIFAVGNIVEIGFRRQIAFAVMLISAFARATIADRRMVVAVEGKAIELVIADQFAANFDQIMSPRAEIAAQPRAEIVFQGFDLFRRVTVGRMNAPVGMFLHQRHGRKRR